MTSTTLVEAAGGVIWRTVDGELQVAVVHRPKYGDWTFPKGKLEPGETPADAARREVLEETGMRCGLGVRLASTRYRDRKGRDKRVRYWAMQVEKGSFRANDEVDELRWLPVARARTLLSYDHDRDVLDSLVESLKPAS